MLEDARLRASSVKAPHGARVLEIGWSDGQKHAYPHEILRGYCPCAGCQGHSGAIQYQPGHNLDIREIEQVGNYALSFVWGDGHSSGIYTFRFLRGIGELLETHGKEGLIALGELPRT